MAISDKQMSILAFPYTSYDALIADGAIRSGKTTFMIMAFVDDAMRRFNGQRFGICGRTVDSTVKNIIMPYMAMTGPKEKYGIQWKRSDKLLIVTEGDAENYFEVFGGKDESSFMLIQGRTLAGALFDEVALQPRSFVDQAMARCSVKESKLWFNCNPGSPSHWFYKDWILEAKKHNALHLHFQLEDNPALDESIINRYKTMYSGVFYDRYIRGLWVVAEGLVYPGFDNTVPTIPRPYEKYVISMDYGIQNPTAMGLWGLCDGVWYQVAEYYHSGRETNEQKTDQQYYDALVKLAGDLPIWRLIIDPSASSFIALVNQKKRFTILKANNDVLDGIQHTAQCLAEGKIKVNDCCKRTIQEYGLYRWDEKSNEDKPIKENDHAMDMTRYFVNTMGIWRKKTAYTPLIYR